MTSEMLAWVYRPQVEPLDLNKLAPRTSPALYALRQLGSGVHGSVFLACNVERKHAVVKVPSRLMRQGEDGDGGERSQNQTLEAEHARWVKLAAGRTVYLRTINRRPALVMPYFLPVVYSTLDDNAINAAAREAVTRAAEAGLCHKDLRWDHVALYEDASGVPHGVLLDLAIVEEFDPANAALKAKAMSDMRKQLAEYPIPGRKASDCLVCLPRRA